MPRRNLREVNAKLPITYSQFAAWVQDALNHLYDSPHLQNHPLAGLLRAQSASRLQRGQNLRRVLVNAILALSPEPGTPAQSPDWRAYRILELHFIEGQPPQQVMRTLGLGRTLYFKEKARMIEALIQALWERCGELFDPRNVSAEALPTHDGPAEELITVHPLIEPLSLAQVLDELRAMLAPLAQARGCALACTAHDDVQVQADRVLLRQAILDVAGHALEMSELSTLTLQTFSDAQAHGVCVRPDSQAQAKLPESALALATHLMRLMGGRVIAEPQEICLVWPVVNASPKTLLVIDDNPGLIQLFRRYLTSHAWRVVEAATLTEAIAAADEHSPDAIALDVMLPRQDGWEILRALKLHEKTRHAPVIICSVMHQPELASQLGAAGYLKKPVTQEQLLQALAPWT